ncbi:hypothetical protein GRZ55_19295 [Chelativorans sp. ZYF759]|uniref:hypothetical protein n=1 Tax=Chelativorans sp. ZYF759 TaxID=2692213 RepID=UPI00145DC8C5|nr:hypothetical protein [Chelativorans sp. ZYF759]NMG41394.1 hypothetical protein [Chelativorans sp. ZYF759]
MTTKFAAITALSLLLALGTTSPSWAQAEEEHDAHHPEADSVLPGAAEAGTPDTSPDGTMGGMSPGMMMGQMPGMMGGGMQGMMGRCPMMQEMMQGQSKMRHGMMGRGAVQGERAGHGSWLYGLPGGQPEETTPETARAWLEMQLLQHGNPRLRIGAVERGEDGTVIAEIETVDGSLVQRLAFNRHPGFVRQAEE